MVEHLFRLRLNPLRMTSFRLAALGIACLLPLVATGCDGNVVGATDSTDEVFQTTDTPIVEIQMFNGSIDLSIGEPNEVVAEVKRVARSTNRKNAEELLNTIDVSMKQTDNTIRITAKRGSRRGNTGASAMVVVPKGAQVKLVSSNGPIVCEGLEGELKALTSNAKIAVYEGHNSINATTSNGPIEIEATGASVEAVTSNARIRFKGTLAEKEHVFTSSNGDIRVWLPADAQFDFKATTSNGQIDCEFPFKSDKARSRRHQAGRVGDNPHRTLELTTSNASIDIRPIKSNGEREITPARDDTP